MSPLRSQTTEVVHLAQALPGAWGVYKTKCGKTLRHMRAGLDEPEFWEKCKRCFHREGWASGRQVRPEEVEIRKMTSGCYSRGPGSNWCSAESRSRFERTVYVGDAYAANLYKEEGPIGSEWWLHTTHSFGDKIVRLRKRLGSKASLAEIANHLRWV